MTKVFIFYNVKNVDIRARFLHILEMYKILVAFIFCLATHAFAQESPTYYISPSLKDGAPKMPLIRLDEKKLNASTSSAVVLESKSEHKKRANKDNIKTKSPLTKTSPYEWDMQKYFGSKIFGGAVVVKSEDGKSVLANFKLRGMNPNDADVVKFIKANCGVHWYAVAIARHESRQRNYVFNQFNSSYYKPSIVGVPNCGMPDGWGIMQIDSRRGSDILTNEVYNWQDNVRGGIKVMDKARTEAIGYFNAIKRTFPDKWENPPAYILLKGTNTKLSYLDACTIQLYNGASVVRRLKTAFGTYSYYRSAFEFDENADEGERWRFKANVNNYVYKVVYHELEGNLKAVNEPLKK